MEIESFAKNLSEKEISIRKKLGAVVQINGYEDSCIKTLGHQKEKIVGHVYQINNEIKKCQIGSCERPAYFRCNQDLKLFGCGSTTYQGCNMYICDRHIKISHDSSGKVAYYCCNYHPFTACSFNRHLKSG